MHLTLNQSFLPCQQHLLFFIQSLKHTHKQKQPTSKQKHTVPSLQQHIPALKTLSLPYQTNLHVSSLQIPPSAHQGHYKPPIPKQHKGKKNSQKRIIKTSTEQQEKPSPESYY